jgi:Gram-negative bacterial TonB protein C-terminal
MQFLSLGLLSSQADAGARDGAAADTDKLPSNASKEPPENNMSHYAGTGNGAGEEGTEDLISQLEAIVQPLVADFLHHESAPGSAESPAHDGSGGPPETMATALLESISSEVAALAKSQQPDSTEHRNVIDDPPSAEDDPPLILPPEIEHLRKKFANAAFEPAFRRAPEDNAITSEPTVTSPGEPELPVSTTPPTTTAAAKTIPAPNEIELHPRVSESVPTFRTFKFGYLPARGLLYSIIGHELAILGLFLLFQYGLPLLQGARLLVEQSNAQEHRVVYLPEMGGGSEGEKSPGSGPSAPQQKPGAPAHASKGFAYPGPQPILSNPPNPTNAFQTIERPLLVHPEQIRKLVPLPNIVQLAEVRLPNELVAPQATLPHLQPTPKPIRVKQDSRVHRPAKWQAPVNDVQKLLAKADMPKLPAAEQPLPEAPKVERPAKQEQQNAELEKPVPKPIKVTAEKRGDKMEKQVAPPSTAQIARLEMHGKATEPLLSLSPMPLAATAKARVPAGEARGRFAIAPGGTLNPNTINPGKSNVPLSTTPGMGQDQSQSANAASDSTAQTGAGSGHASVGGTGAGSAPHGSGGSRLAGSGSGSVAGEGPGGAGTGKGRGPSGSGSGASGHGTGTGSGAGSGAGTGAFPGITIQGGEEEANATHNPPAFTVEPQTAYQMTIVATASSGGGIEDIGVFSNQRVFTVYFPMKRSEAEADPAWTMQYALLQDSSPTDASSAEVLAPGLAKTDWPQIPADLQKRYPDHQVVIYAVIDKDGKIGQIEVKRTPDPRISDPIADALKKWSFHPAQLNNRPVAVKVLFGIPL